MLDVRGVSKRFGGLLAVDHVDLDVQEGEIRCLVGPNGAGKTTLFNLLAGTLRPSSGEIRFRGRRIDGLRPQQVARAGIARKFQAPATFEELTVLDNLRVARDGKHGPLRLLLTRRQDDGELLGVLDEIGLAEHAGVHAGSLAHGQRQWLEIGMTLVNEPSLLLLDEPTAGMSDQETTATAELVRRIARTRRLTTVVIEHDIDFVRMLGDRVTVLHKGRVLVEGSVREIEGNAEVRRVYLGGDG
jgi:urea ABC transporter ATP-binding protein UrtD